jgi:aminoglycoside phosphotransferase
VTDWAGWELVGGGRTTAVVRRSPAGLVHAKSAAGAHDAADLAAERDRLLWLAGTPVPSPRVVDWVEDGPGGVPTLVTSTVPGVPLSSVRDPVAVVDALVAALRALHSVPVPDCPYDARLAVRLDEAVARVRDGVVDEDDFDDERAGWSAAAVLAEVRRRAAGPGDLEPGDLAVCHGDLTPANVLVDAGSLRLTGVIDVGRLGVADRHQDLALATRGLDADAGAALLAAQPWRDRVDPARLDLYRLLDELF